MSRLPTSLIARLLAPSILLFTGACALQPSEPAPAAEPPPAVDEVAEVPPAAEPEAAPALPVEPPAGDSGKAAKVAPPTAPVWNREDVLWIQQRLQELGYYDGAVDGAPGSGTQRAIREYQQDQAVKVDGRPTPALRDYMWRNGG